MGGDGDAPYEAPPAPAPAPAPKKKEGPKVVYDSPEHEQAEKAKAEGNAHYMKKEFAKALECYAQAKTLQPKNPTYLNNEAAAYLELKDYDKCETTCKEGIRLAREVGGCLAPCSSVWPVHFPPLAPLAFFTFFLLFCFRCLGFGFGLRVRVWVRAWARVPNPNPNSSG
jgi:hypothetical protein